jgi:dTDP-4-amino-4,6-dideoxygalactose transaminase
VFVDIDEATYNLDAGKVRAYLENQCRRVDGRVVETRSGLRVAALVPVHQYGQPADMDAFLALGEEFGLTVMEDACQAHGAEYYSAREGRWRRAGSMGRAAAFSFYPGKNLGACGEGGAVTTNDAALAAKIRVLRDHGQSKKYYHEVEGFNGRLDAIQAGILQKKLKRLPTWTEQRRAAAERYRKLFEAAECDVMLPWEPTWAKAVYHLYVIRAQRRDELMQVLGAAGIGSALHYPVPLHLQEAYQYLGHREGDFPVTEKVTKEIVSLPMFPALTEEQQARVVAHTTSFVTAAVKAG